MVRILSDSGCDLTPAQAAALGVELIPLNITLEDGSILRDGIEVGGDAFFDHLKACKKLPRTSQPAPALFARAFAGACQDGGQAVCITVSREVSGTYQSAAIGADMAGCTDSVFLVDSRTATLAQGLLVRTAAALRDAGLPADQIAARLDALKAHLHVYVVVDDLKYLHKGGRLPATVAVAGGMLGVKPLATAKNGRVCLCGTARGLPGAYVALFRRIDACGGLSDNLPAAALYSDSRKQLDPIARYFANTLRREAPLPVQLGAVIGSHLGPGAFGLAFFDRDADLL